MLDVHEVKGMIVINIFCVEHLLEQLFIVIGK